MKAPQYIINNIDLNRYNKYKMNLHLLKLKDIKSRKNNVVSNTPSPQKILSNNYIQHQKKIDIYKENKALFGRLVNISQNYSKVSENSLTYSRNNYRSSYEITRKNQERKIAEENEKIVKKLTDIKPVLRKKTLDQEYSEYKKRKRRLLKVGCFESGKSFESDRSLRKGNSLAF